MFPETPRWFRWTRDKEQARRIALLAQAPVFAGLPRRFLGRIGAQLFEKGYTAGEVVFQEGEPGKGLFIVLEGSVDIVRAAGQKEQTLVTLGPGASFGEMALIDDLPRSATVRVVTASRLLILYRTNFEALVEGDRAIALAVMRNLLKMLAAYVRHTNALLAERRQPEPDSRATDAEPQAGVP